MIDGILFKSDCLCLLIDDDLCFKEKRCYKMKYSVICRGGGEAYNRPHFIKVENKYYTSINTRDLFGKLHLKVGFHLTKKQPINTRC